MANLNCNAGTPIQWHAYYLIRTYFRAYLIDQALFRIESILAAKDTQNTTQMFDVGEMGHGDEVLRYYKNYHTALFM